MVVQVPIIESLGLRASLVDADVVHDNGNGLHDGPHGGETVPQNRESPMGFWTVLNSPCFLVKSWLVQDQTALGKDYSNLLIADSLLKTIWFINAPCYDNEALASPNTNDEELSIPEQTATGKGTSNPLMAGDLDNLTSNVLIPLDSWTSGLLVYRLPSNGKWDDLDGDGERGFDYLTFALVSSKAHHEGCRASRDSIISSKYPQLLLDENMLNLKSFKDKLPPNIDENPYFQRLGRYPTSVRVFDDPIIFLAGLKPSWEFGQQRHAIIMGSKEMAFRNFIYTEDDDDLAFLPKEPSPGFGTGSPSALVNTELPKDFKEPKVQLAEITADSEESSKVGVFIMYSRSVAARIKERKCKMRGGSSRPHVKRKLAFRSSSSHVVRAKTSASKDDAPILSIFDDDEGKFPVHLVLFKGIDLLIHHLSSLYVIEKMSGEADVIKTMERSREEECKELRVKCEAAMAEFDQNPVVLVLRDKISSPTAHVKEHKEVEKARLEAVEASFRREVEELKQDRRDVVSKVIPYAAMKLVHSDELGRLVGTLVSSAITYGRCRAYEQVAAIKDPFDLSKAKGYRSSYKKEHTQKPPTLQKPTPSRTQMHVPSSQKATPSSAPSSNPMSYPVDLMKPSLSPFE
ncbi:hypothetical protein Tco_0158458 [Tanacetum coccineum]